MCWGDLDENGKPVSKEQGKCYMRWVHKVCSFGYHFDHRILNAADCPYSCGVGISCRSRDDDSNIFLGTEDSNPHGNIMGVYSADGGSSKRNEGGNDDTDIFMCEARTPSI